VRAQDLREGDWLTVPKRKELRKTTLSNEQLYAVGFWLAEGHFRETGVGASNAERAYVERVGAALQSWFPEPSHFKIYKRPGDDKAKPLYELKYYSRAARRYFENFGHVCDDKRISPALFKHRGLLPLVSGFIDGDGSQRKNAARDVNIYTTSETLACSCGRS